MACEERGTELDRASPAVTSLGAGRASARRRVRVECLSCRRSRDVLGVPRLAQDSEAEVREEAVSFDVELREALAGWDVAGLRTRYEEQGHFLLVDDFVPKRVLEPLLRDLATARPHIHRSRIPTRKQGGSVARSVLAKLGCRYEELYTAGALREFCETVTGAALQLCPDDDLHGCALYAYTEPGDHIAWHYDTSFYRGRRFTALIGLVENASYQLECELFRRDPTRPRVRQSHTLRPGSLALFDGDALRHRITPLARGDEDRFVLTLEYVTDPSMGPLRRLVSQLKDATAYFGVRAVFARPPRH